jgi:undecaprenyl-diphosphatase
MLRKTAMRLAIFFFIAFFLVAVNLNDASVIENDELVSSYAINHQIFWIHDISSFLSIIFEPIYVVLFILLFGCLLWALKYREESLYLIFISGFSGVLIFLLKHLFVRERPIIQFLAETGYSFPSGHALISVVLFGSLIYFGFRIKKNYCRNFIMTFSYLGIAVLGLSRVYLNVHWFSDILGGYFLGATIIFVGIIFFKSNIFQKVVNLFYPK